MPVRIRRAQPADLDQLSTLWKELADFHAVLDPKFALASNAKERWRENMAPLLEDDNWGIFVAEDNSRLVGFISGVVRSTPDVFLERQHGHITDAFVTERLRRRGIGEQLYRALAEWFHKRGITVIELNVAVANSIAQAFWRKMGFKDWMTRLVIGGSQKTSKEKVGRD